jgi:hypothetical protein
VRVIWAIGRPPRRFGAHGTPGCGYVSTADMSGGAALVKAAV